MLFLAETYVVCVNVFYVVRNEILARSDKGQIISPNTPIVKIAHFGNVRHDVTKVGDFYNGGLWGIVAFFVGSNWNFVSDYIKNADAYHVSFSWKYQILKKKAFAKKRLTN